MIHQIEAHWGLVRRRGRNVEAHVYWLDDKAVGTTIADVQRRIKGPTRTAIAAACLRAKEDGKPAYIWGDS